MGLDNFKRDEQSETETKEDDVKEEKDEETPSSEVGGLEAFKSENFIDEEEIEEQKVFEEQGWTEELANKNLDTKEEQIGYIRENFIKDYRPEFQADERWEHTEVIEVECVCGNSFVFREKGMCLQCGRAYEDVGRTVVKTHEPENKEDNANQ